MTSATQHDHATDFNPDPYSREVLADPYPYYARLREAGAVVWLSRWKIWALPRYREVNDALSDWKTFTSAHGVGHDDFTKEKPWRPPSIILEADPPLHTRTRGVLTRILSPLAVRRLRETFQREADILVDRLVEQGAFDAAVDLAEVYPLKVFPDAMGLPEAGQISCPMAAWSLTALGRETIFFMPRLMAAIGPFLDYEQLQQGEARRRRLRLADFCGGRYRRAERERGRDAVPDVPFGGSGYDGGLDRAGDALLLAFSRSMAAPSPAARIGAQRLRRGSPLRGSVYSIFPDDDAPGQHRRHATRRRTKNADARRQRKSGYRDTGKIQTAWTSREKPSATWRSVPACRLCRPDAGSARGECILNAFLQRAETIEPAGEPIPQFNNTMRLFNTIPLRVRRAAH